MTAMQTEAWRNMRMPQLHIEGRYLMDEDGNKVNLHGIVQTYSPWFNEKGTKWTNYNVQACLSYNQDLITKILDNGFKINVLRLHMDPYWSNTNNEGISENDISRFSMTRFKKYYGEVFYEMAKFCEANGIYVVMRPPGVCPKDITVGDDYQKYLIKVWTYVAQKLVEEGNTTIMIELANEPVNIHKKDETTSTSASYEYFQPIVDAIRQQGCNNIIWVPGPGYQSDYRDYVTTPIEGNNIGYAIHCYPGWYGSDAEVESAEHTGDVSGGGYQGFFNGWHERIHCITEKAPILVTEMDWAPKIYDKSWGKSTTGVRGGNGFGANFKFLCDVTGNVSWTVFTSPEHLAKYDDTAADGSTFLTDPEACPRPVYRWFKDYAAEWPDPTDDARKLVSFSLGCDDNMTVLTGNTTVIPVDATFADGHKECLSSKADYDISNPTMATVTDGLIKCKEAGETDMTISYTDAFGTRKEATVHLNLAPFPLSLPAFNPNIWDKGTFDEATGTLTTGTYGFGGWNYSDGLDMSGYKYIIIELSARQEIGASFRLFDVNDYWSKPAMIEMGTSTRIVKELSTLKKQDNTSLNPQHIYIAGFWSYGGKPIKIKQIFLSNDKNATGATAIDAVLFTPKADGAIHNLNGQRIAKPAHGIYIQGGKIYIAQ